MVKLAAPGFQLPKTQQKPLNATEQELASDAQYAISKGQNIEQVIATNPQIKQYIASVPNFANTLRSLSYQKQNETLNQQGGMNAFPQNVQKPVAGPQMDKAYLQKDSTVKLKYINYNPSPEIIDKATKNKIFYDGKIGVFRPELKKAFTPYNLSGQGILGSRQISPPCAIQFLTFPTPGTGQTMTAWNVATNQIEIIPPSKDYLLKYNGVA
jgi:hypothetical protein